MADDSNDVPLFGSTDNSAAALVAHWRARHRMGSLNVTLEPLVLQATGTSSGTSLAHAVSVPDSEAVSTPEISIGAALVSGEPVPEGSLIRAIEPAWWEVLRRLQHDPAQLLKLTPRQFEEAVAGGFRDRDLRVILTPRSGDFGVDIIVESGSGLFGFTRMFVQAKRYAPKRLVPANDVRTFWGVINDNRGVTKGAITTTSGFAPGAHTEFADRSPQRLVLVDGERLRSWLLNSLSAGARSDLT